MPRSEAVLGIKTFEGCSCSVGLSELCCRWDIHGTQAGFPLSTGASYADSPFVSSSPHTACRSPPESYL